MNLHIWWIDQNNDQNGSFKSVYIHYISGWRFIRWIDQNSDKKESFTSVYIHHISRLYELPLYMVDCSQKEKVCLEPQSRIMVRKLDDEVNYRSKGKKIGNR